METLSEIGEHEAIRRLTSMLGSHPDLAVGAGDDCAVCHVPGASFDQVFTTDPIIENIHFLSDDDPRLIGNKAAGRVLSDLAAMGAGPQWLLANVVAPPDLEVNRLEVIYEGMNALCKRFGATLIGGDLAEGPVLELHLFATGILPSGTALLRSGAKSDDIIHVTGPLGCSSNRHHLDFVPRVEEGIFLRESGCVHAMMDVSDGLATDLRHIMDRSGVGAELDEEAIPKNGTLERALFDGEDFELLLTTPREKAEKLEEAWRKRFGSDLAPIGVVTDAGGILQLKSSDGRSVVIESKGFEHFSAGKTI